MHEWGNEYDCPCVRLWEDGWKQRYYKTKFDVDATDDDFRKKVVMSYVEGLCWVLRYYYQVQLTQINVYLSYARDAESHT